MSPLKRDPQTLGERLFLVRNEHGLTWGTVADLLGVKTLDVAAYEQGHPLPQQVLVAFSDVFAVQWDWLLLGVGQRYTPASLLFAADTLHL
jgi:transcriptional regulator with XRE-family HTH domain